MFTEAEFPRIDGSTANIPLGQALYRALAGKTAQEAEELVAFSGTPNAWYNLMRGNTDLLLVYEPDEYTASQTLGSLEYAPIGRDALVFLVNAKNTVSSLTTEQLQSIYTGEAKNWADVGGGDTEIVAYQRDPTSGSQALMEKHVMQGLEMADAASELTIQSMMGLVEVVADYQNTQSAIGYNVFYYVSQMKPDPSIKLLGVDGVTPSNGTIRSGDYPFVNDFYVAIRQAERANSPARKIYEWLQGADGQRLVHENGYVSVMPAESAQTPPQFELGEIGERYYPGFMDKLLPRGDYGPIYPYNGGGADPGTGEPFNYGFCTLDGKIITDAVFPFVRVLTHEDKSIYLLQKLLADGEGTRMESTFAAMDGSWAVTYWDCEIKYTEYGGRFVPDPVSGFISVNDGNGWGAIDFDGRQVYPCTAAHPMRFNDGMAVVFDGGMYHYVDFSGRRVLGPYEIPEEYIQSGYTPRFDFSNGYAPSYKEALWGVIDTQGQWDYSESLAERPEGSLLANGWRRIYVESGQFTLTKDGVTVNAPYEPTAGLPGDRFLFRDYKERVGSFWGVFDISGEIILKDQPGYAYALPSGRLGVESNAYLYGVWDSEFNELIPPRFGTIWEIGDCFAVREGRYGGLVDLRGEWIVKRLILDSMAD
jgi:ABC-type phosphate transport system substrate-binding protein